MGPQYPKWVRSPGHPETVVDNEAGEVELLAKWAAEDAAAAQKTNPITNVVGNALVGASMAVPTAVASIAALRIEYKEKTGKRAFPGWNADEIRARMATAA